MPAPLMPAPTTIRSKDVASRLVGTRRGMPA
jgi:hypothetical protein